jgi:hypothetical protein
LKNKREPRKPKQDLSSKTALDPVLFKTVEKNGRRSCPITPEIWGTESSFTTPKRWNKEDCPLTHSIR